MNIMLQTAMRFFFLKHSQCVVVDFSTCFKVQWKVWFRLLTFLAEQTNIDIFYFRYGEMSSDDVNKFSWKIQSQNQTYIL